MMLRSKVIIAAIGVTAGAGLISAQPSVELVNAAASAKLLPGGAA